MKSSKEMADSVFRIRDAYIEKRNKRRLYIKRTAFVASTACMFVLVIVGIKLTMPERPPQVPDIGVIGTSDSVGSDIAATTVRASSPASTTPVQTAGTAAETVTATQTQAASSETRSVASTTTATSDEEGLSYLEDDVESETEATRRTTAATTAVSRRTTSTVTSALTYNGEQTTTPVVTTAPQTTTVFVMTQAVATVAPDVTVYPSVVETTPTVPAQIYERYRTVEVNKGIYTTKGWEARSIEIGEQICTAELVSNDSLMTCNATIYECVSLTDAFYKPVIIKFDGYDGYWIYSRSL
jgi:hypothetical protein